MEAAELEQRKQLARALLTSEAEGLRLGAASAAPVASGLLGRGRAQGIAFPQGLAPAPEAPAEASPEAPLPEADVLVITWTAAEADALADVLTPGFERRRWRWYRRRFDEHYEALIRAGAPARMAGRLGSWLRTEIGGQSVICFKSELHLNQDGVATGEGTATLPVKDLLLQLIAEASPAVVLTIGTAGGVAADQDLGDAIVTRAAKFRCRDEFRNEPFNGRAYRSDWEIPTRSFTTARELMQGFAPELVEPAFAPPTKRYRFEGPPLVSSPPNRPDIELDGDDFPAFHPILTTDFFEFGTSANRLDAEGCGVEMGDAVLGLACSELEDPPRWAVVRNVSDPVINADLPTHADITRNMQAVWAVWFYEAYGYWTSVTGALAAWGIIAGLSSHE